ncbi:MAG: hypothetical protein K1X88_13260 [Nannocystaceae bacterium]|nr:hypothetical protein [Nannocystaceae bacterium]
MPVINIVPRRSFSFSTTTTVTLATNVDVGQWRESTLLVRLHATGLGTGSTAAFNAKTIAPSRDEPNVEFVNSTAVATVSFSNTDTAGTLGRGAFTANFGATIKLELVATKGSGTCDFTISVDLVTKE